jgi:hypothetical protein
VVNSTDDAFMRAILSGWESDSDAPVGEMPRVRIGTTASVPPGPGNSQTYRREPPPGNRAPQPVINPPAPSTAETPRTSPIPEPGRSSLRQPTGPA